MKNTTLVMHIMEILYTQRTF